MYARREYSRGRCTSRHEDSGIRGAVLKARHTAASSLLAVCHHQDKRTRKGQNTNQKKDKNEAETRPVKTCALKVPKTFFKLSAALHTDVTDPSPVEC